MKLVLCSLDGKLEKAKWQVNYSELLLGAILIIGFALRMFYLGSESIWLDEFTSIVRAKLDLLQILDVTAKKDVHPPLSYAVLHYWIKFLGNSEISVRFPSVIFGFLAIFMIYKVGSLIFDKETGILSSLILALSVFHIHYSQEARMYSLLVLLTLLSMYFFIKLLKEKTLTVSVGYTLSSVLLIYTHYYGFLILLVQNIYVFTLLLFTKKNYKFSFKRWLILQGLLIVLFIPWIRILMKQVALIQTGHRLGWVQVPSFETIINSFERYSGSTFLLVFFLILSSFSIVAHKIINSDSFHWRGSLKTVEEPQWRNRFSSTGRIYFLLLWLFVPIIFPFIISKISAPVYLYRGAIGVSLAFYLLTARGIRNINFSYAKLSIIAVIILLSAVNLREYYTEADKEQWRDVADYIDTNARSSDLILFHSGFTQMLFDNYSRRSDLAKKQFPEEVIDVNEENIGELNPVVRNYNRVWVIMSHGKDNKGLIKKTLVKSYNLSSANKYFDIEVYLFEFNENI